MIIGSICEQLNLNSYLNSADFKYVNLYRAQFDPFPHFVWLHVCDLHQATKIRLFLLSSGFKGLDLQYLARPLLE